MNACSCTNACRRCGRCCQCCECARSTHTAWKWSGAPIIDRDPGDEVPHRQLGFRTPFKTHPTDGPAPDYPVEPESVEIEIPLRLRIGVDFEPGA